MRRRCLVALALVVATASAALLYGVGCASSHDQPPVDVGANVDGSPFSLTTTEDAGEGGKAGDAAAACAPASGCNDLGICGSRVYLVGAAQGASPPSGTGGTFTPGTYYLQSATAYGVAGVAVGVNQSYWFQDTFRILVGDGGGVAEAGADAGALEGGAADAGSVTVPVEYASQDYVSSAQNYTGVFLLTGASTFSESFACGGTGSPGGTYTATANSFTLFLSQQTGNSELVDTYVLVP